jgi:hypothetical protein
VGEPDGRVAAAAHKHERDEEQGYAFHTGSMRANA